MGDRASSARFRPPGEARVPRLEGRTGGGLLASRYLGGALGLTAEAAEGLPEFQAMGSSSLIAGVKASLEGAQGDRMWPRMDFCEAVGPS